MKCENKVLDVDFKCTEYDIQYTIQNITCTYLLHDVRKSQHILVHFNT